jgi:two-component system response regulator AlgR
MSSLRTLIVDDEPLARSRLRTLLAECRAPAADVVGEAAQAKEAEQRLDETPTDLVLLDIHMPGIGGTEFARLLRGRADAPAIVFVTAHSGHAGMPDPNEEVFLIQDRGRAERVPVSEVVYLKSEFKYLTVRTPARTHIYDASLAEIEERYPDRFVRVHRNALVARSAMRALEKYDDGEDVDGWALRLRGIAEPVVVSRRQLPVVRDALKDVR